MKDAKRSDPRGERNTLQNMFGEKDNRLGGSKTAYRTDYKPLNPNPAYGPVNYDAIWDFKA